MGDGGAPLAPATLAALEGRPPHMLPLPPSLSSPPSPPPSRAWPSAEPEESLRGLGMPNSPPTPPTTPLAALLLLLLLLLPLPPPQAPAPAHSLRHAAAALPPG